MCNTARRGHLSTLVLGNKWILRFPRRSQETQLPMSFVGVGAVLQREPFSATKPPGRASVPVPQIPTGLGGMREITLFFKDMLKVNMPMSLWRWCGSASCQDPGPTCDKRAKEASCSRGRN